MHSREQYHGKDLNSIHILDHGMKIYQWRKLLSCIVCLLEHCCLFDKYIYGIQYFHINAPKNKNKTGNPLQKTRPSGTSCFCNGFRLKNSFVKTFLPNFASMCPLDDKIILIKKNRSMCNESMIRAVARFS